jgi:RHS repeat-associated protein
LLTGNTGSIVSRFSYDAYGNTLGQTLGVLNSPLSALLYSGEQFDSDLGQYYLRARYYDPSNGRFNRLDPFAGSNFDPQSLHKYAYAYEDPINGLDPGGESPLIEFLATITIEAILWLGRLSQALVALWVTQPIIAFFTVVGIVGGWHALITGRDEYGEPLTALGYAMAALQAIPGGGQATSTTGKTVKLVFKAGMDKRDFLRKAKALQDLARRGKLVRVENPVLRDKTLTGEYKSRIIEKIWENYSHDPAKRDALIAKVKS